jgi:hypothetical protein
MLNSLSSPLQDLDEAVMRIAVRIKLEIRKRRPKQGATLMYRSRWHNAEAIDGSIIF